MEQTLQPTVFQPGSLVYQVVDALAEEIGLMFDAIDFLVLQAFDSTASLTLPLREAVFGIPTDLTLPLIQRQNAVLAAERAGNNPSLPQYRVIAQAVDPEAMIRPIVDPLANELYLLFTGSEGVPPNLAALENVMNTQTAARLGINYLFLYLLWSHNDAWNTDQGPTGDEVDGLTDPVAGAGGYLGATWDIINPAAPPAGLTAG